MNLKNNPLVYVIFFLVLIGAFVGCVPKTELASPKGSLNFYTKSIDNIGNANVTVDGSIFLTANPGNGILKFDPSSYYLISPGNHTYQALSFDNSMQWSGNFNVTSSNCTNIELSRLKSIPTGLSPSTIVSYYIPDKEGIYFKFEYTRNNARFDLAVTNFGSNSFNEIAYKTGSSPLEYSFSSDIPDGSYLVSAKFNGVSYYDFSTLLYSISGKTLPMFSNKIIGSKTYTDSTPKDYYSLAKVTKSNGIYTITNLLP